MPAPKRKADESTQPESQAESSKKRRTDDLDLASQGPSGPSAPSVPQDEGDKGSYKNKMRTKKKKEEKPLLAVKPKRPKVIKLAPNRPFPKVALSSNATGPYSARSEGKNLICVTRRLGLGAYLRRCVDIVKQDGYRTIRISALGAAIPHALLLTTSLPAILPFPQEEITTSVRTGTVQCIDEVLPDEDNEEEDEGGMQTREKSCIDIEIKIGDGERVDTKMPKKKIKITARPATATELLDSIL